MAPFARHCYGSGMKRPLRVVALTLLLLGTFYLISLLPWLGRLTEERTLQTQMAATAPIHLSLPEPRARESGLPEKRFGKSPNGGSGCSPGRPDPNCVPAQMNRVTDLIELGRFEEARDRLLDMLKALPGNVNALNTLGLLYRHRLDDPERAEHFFRLALQANPDRMDIAGALGDIYTESRSLNDGLRYFRGLDARHPNNANLKMALGALELEDGAQEKGVAHLRQAIRLMPDLARAYDLLADAHLRAGRPESAASTLQRLLHHYLDQKQKLTERNEPTTEMDSAIARVRASLTRISLE